MSDEQSKDFTDELLPMAFTLQDIGNMKVTASHLQDDVLHVTVCVWPFAVENREVSIEVE